MELTAKISTDLFNFLEKRFQVISALDANGKETEDKQAMKIFGFEFSTVDKQKVGSVVVSIVNEPNQLPALKIYYGKDVTDSTVLGKDHEFTDFLASLRKFSKARLMSFDVRDVNRANVSKQTLAILARKSRLTEGTNFSPLSGTIKKSEQFYNDIKLVIHHSKKVDPSNSRSRTRKIHQIYIFTPSGERFLLPFVNLTGARIMACHVHQGGNPYDLTGTKIAQLIDEYLMLARFLRKTRSKSYVDQMASELVQSCKSRYSAIRSLLAQLLEPDHCIASNQELNQCTDECEEFDHDSLASAFTTQQYDESLDSSLPYVWRAHRLANRVFKEGKLFSDDPTHIAEAVKELNELLKNKLPCSKAKKLLGHLIWTNELDAICRNQRASLDFWKCPEALFAIKQVLEGCKKPKTVGDALIDEASPDQIQKTLATTTGTIAKVIPVPGKAGQGQIVVPDSNTASKITKAMGSKLGDTPVVIDKKASMQVK